MNLDQIDRARLKGRWSLHDIEVLVSMWNDDVLIREIAKHFGRSTSLIKKVAQQLQALGVIARRNPRLSDLDLQYLVAKRQQGVSAEQVAHEMGCCSCTVYMVMKRMDLVKRRQRVEQERRNKMLQLHADGLTHQQIAEALRCHRDTVRRHIYAVRAAA